MTVRARFFLTAAVAAAVLFVLFVTGPPSAVRLEPADGHTVRGAMHIHTTRSDGALSKAEVAAAAARAGLQFAIFTEHGDGTEPPDPPAYIEGVLCLDGVEISTNDGHYLAVDLPAAPYPLGGDAAAVIEDVARLGGFGVVAHPGSPRSELAWSDWSAPVGAMEWLNADSQWRDESGWRLFRALLDYLWRPAGALAALFDRPVAVLGRWDDLSASRPVVGLAGHDAHGGFGAEADGGPGRRLHVPSYDAAFRTFSLYVHLGAPLSGEAGTDASRLLGAIREGRVFTAIDALASPASLEFTASAGGRRAFMGGILPANGAPSLFRVRASAPRSAVTRLVRNGSPVAQAAGGALEHSDVAPGAYRVEVDIPRAPGRPPIPWLVSNPIYRLAVPHTGEPPGRPEDVLGALDLEGDHWRAEFSPGSTAVVLRQRHSVGLWYRLADGPPGNQFAALVADLRGVPRDATRILLKGRAQQPMRVSVQLRYAENGGGRWRRSVYLEPTARDAMVSVARLRPADGADAQPTLAAATSLLFVVDLTNARPGGQGSFALTEVGFK